MKKIIAIFSFFLLFLAAKNVYAGKRITIEGVQYETISENTVSARFTIQAKGEITVLEFVSINKKNYSVVMLGKSFTKNNKVTAVILPQSLKTIKTGAFNGFPNMKRLVLPTGEYTIEQDAFVECDAVMNIEGNVSPFLEYKGKNGKVIKVESMKKPDIPKFSTYAEDKLKSRMKIWQTKKEYETAE